ncbi:MAG: alpha/beta hydrolase [Mobilicoccus sp.]|nr:alpha/beta hydrolase [Mobilicoccus sp.]
MLRIGDGDHAILCLHGWYGHAHGWGYLPDVIDTDRFTYWLPEMRGYGDRRSEQGDYTMWEFGTDAIAAADEAGLERFSLLGHSMGGKAAAAVLAQVPERVQAFIGLSAVWVAPTPLDDDGEALFFGAPQDPQKRYGIIDFTTGNRHSAHWVQSMVDDSLATSTTEAFTGAVESWVRDDYTEQVGTIEVPALFITGAHDPALSADLARQTWLPAAPQGRVVELAGSGHYATHEEPVALATTIEAFLTE